MTDIIVLSYNDTLFIDKCLMSIKDTCSDYNLIIINNNRTNLGFSAGVNKGLKMSKAPYVWLLNSDAIVTEGAQNALLQLLNNQPKAGMVSGMQIHPGNNNIITYGGSGPYWPNGVHIGGFVSRLDCNTACKQEWLNFTSVMIKREVIEKVGLLDENMFLLYSDSDYSLRVKEAGFELWYEPHSKVIHTLNYSYSKVNSNEELKEKDKETFRLKWIKTLDQQTEVHPQSK